MWPRSAGRPRAAAVSEALLKERQRMARELHDVAAHHLTGVMVSARALERSRDAEVSRHLRTTIREESQKAMESMRDVIAVLRSEDAKADLPAASANDTQALLDAVATRGVVRIGKSSLADFSVLPPAASHAVYRVIQESLTNAERHAPGSTVAVTSSVDGPVWLEVRTEGGSHGGEVGAGLGLLGMRERVEVLGGTFDAHPSVGGFVVRADFPLVRDGQDVTVANDQGGSAREMTNRKGAP